MKLEFHFLNGPWEIVRFVLALGLMLAVSGCGVLQKTAEMPVKAVTTMVPGMKSSQPDPAGLQLKVQHFADDYSGRTMAALDEFVRQVGTPEAQSQALAWRLSVGSSVLSIASGPNPAVNLIDLITLATLTRGFLENSPTFEANRAELGVWMATSRALETNAWELAATVFTPTQQDELRAAIQGWSKENVGARATFFARPQEFIAAIRQKKQKSGKSDSVFGLIGLDPTMGLDPAVQEITHARLFAERALYTAQRMPYLLSWQTELLADQFLQQKPVAEALSSADRISRAAESVGQTVEILPDRLAAERKAILDALQQQEGQLRELSAEVSRTLSSGEKMSTSLNTTLQTFDALMKRFGVGEPSTNTAPAAPSRPFDILDYAQTADKVALMVKELDVLLKDAGGTIDSPLVRKRMDEVMAEARSVLNHAFLLLALLVILIFGCALGYRRLSFSRRHDQKAHGRRS